MQILHQSFPLPLLLFSRGDRFTLDVDYGFIVRWVKLASFCLLRCLLLGRVLFPVVFLVL